MKNKKCYPFKLYVFLFLIVINSCIEPIKVELSPGDMKSMLVVEGKVTDEPGSFQVRLTKSAPVNTYITNYSFEPIIDAEIYISDDKGDRFQLCPTADGWYETDDKYLKGVPGNTYILHITTADGMLYESTPQVMAEAPPIDSLFYEEKQQTVIKENVVSKENWLTLFLDTHTSGTGVQYFKWEFEETWEFNMPEYIEVVKHVFYEPCRCNIDSVFTKLVYIPSDQLHCWITEPSKSILIKSTASIFTGEVKGMPLISIGPEDDRLGIRYSILVKQFILNKEIYNYLNRLKDLNETNGGMYDKMPAPLFGNIQATSENKKAMGYFFASAVKTKRIFINNRDIHLVTGHSPYSECSRTWEYAEGIHFETGNYFYGIIAPPDRDEGEYVFSRSEYCSDCRERGTDIKPDFW